MKNTSKKWLIAGAAAAVLAGASTMALARGGMGDCDGPMGGQPGPRAEKMEKRMAEHRSQRLTDLKAKLQLNASQEAAWTAFASATQPPMMDAKNRPDPAEMAKLTTPERIEKMQAFKAQRDTHMAQMGEATKTFYASLNAEQKKVFDDQTARGPGHGGEQRGGKGR